MHIATVLLRVTRLCKYHKHCLDILCDLNESLSPTQPPPPTNEPSYHFWKVVHLEIWKLCIFPLRFVNMSLQLSCSYSSPSELASLWMFSFLIKPTIPAPPVTWGPEILLCRVVKMYTDIHFLRLRISTVAKWRCRRQTVPLLSFCLDPGTAKVQWPGISMQRLWVSLASGCSAHRKIKHVAAWEASQRAEVRCRKAVDANRHLHFPSQRWVNLSHFH